ncbi:hypothetical protein HWV23_09035 [Natronomonas halophila]|nr:hypothetical protein [Natronomonas halophila]QLD85862.1 hypothetical protein HWV23_09035 [Natronomonas halophila]
MSTQERSQHVRVVCGDCYYSETVEKEGQTPAEKIIEHGRETGHKLTIEQ